MPNTSTKLNFLTSALDLALEKFKHQNEGRQLTDKEIVQKLEELFRTVLN